VNERPPRSVAREHRFEQEQNEICSDVEWFDSEIADTELLLARFPGFGLSTNSPAVRIAPIILNLPDGTWIAVDLFYTFDHTLLRFLSIQRA
jgi:hypothetical protein